MVSATVSSQKYGALFVADQQLAEHCVSACEFAKQIHTHTN